MSGFIYFLACADRVKIGFTTEPARRVSTISTSSPYPIEVIATMLGTEVEERTIHRALAKARRYGEWFDRTSEVEALIAAVERGEVEDGGEAAAYLGVDVAQTGAMSRAECAFDGIFAHWDSVKEMSADLGLKYTTGQVARLRGRLSPVHWPILIAALSRKGITVTADDLMRAYCAAPVSKSEAA